MVARRAAPPHCHIRSTGFLRHSPAVRYLGERVLRFAAHALCIKINGSLSLFRWQDRAKTIKSMLGERVWKLLGVWKRKLDSHLYLCSCFLSKILLFFSSSLGGVVFIFVKPLKECWLSLVLCQSETSYFSCSPFQGWIQSARAWVTRQLIHSKPFKVGYLSSQITPSGTALKKKKCFMCAWRWKCVLNLVGFNPKRLFIGLQMCGGGETSHCGLHRSALPLTDWNIPHRGLASLLQDSCLCSRRERKKK